MVEQQQGVIEHLTSPQNPPRESRAVPSSSKTQLDAIREEAFNMIPGTVNTMRDTAVLHSMTMVSVPMLNQNSLEDMLVEEANFTTSHQPKHVMFMETMRRCYFIYTCTSTDMAAMKISAYVLSLFIAIYYNYTLSNYLFLFYEHLLEAGSIFYLILLDFKCSFKC